MPSAELAERWPALQPGRFGRLCGRSAGVGLFAPALIQLFATHEEAVFDYIAFRRDMEGLAANGRRGWGRKPTCG
jgi:GntR family transcriptional regulator, transcriptional repressor for pyruvate dehydrogenase complex